MSGTYSNLIYHIVFSTKGRRRLVTRAIEPELFRYIDGIIHNVEGKLLEIGGVEDHIHLLVRLKPKRALSDIVRDIKSNSTGWLNEKKSRLYKFAWQDGFAAFTVSQSQIERVAAYIRNQKNRHKKYDYKAELLELLEKNDVEFDPRYLWT